jgi:glutathione S-transferase
MDVTLYGSGTNRTARVTWTLAETGIAHSVGGESDMIGTDALKDIHPLGKIPAVVIDGKPLYESAAICGYLADQAPEADLIAKPGGWGRSQHDQWVMFCLTEMEAWLWNTAVNSFLLPEPERITAGFEQNAAMYRKSAAILNRELSARDYLVEDRFTVADIIVGWTVNWGRRTGNNDGFPALGAYLDRLFARPHCTLNRDQDC